MKSVDKKIAELRDKREHLGRKGEEIRLQRRALSAEIRELESTSSPDKTDRPSVHMGVKPAALNLKPGKTG